MTTPPHALWVWYRGGGFRGFQRQREGRTVQQVIEQALAQLDVHRAPSPASRTDMGVHARMQVLSIRAAIRSDDLERELNARLPLSECGIAAARAAPPQFHSQWSAVRKEYRYRLVLASAAAPETWKPFAWVPTADERVARAVDIGVLERCIGAMAGTRDFIAFHEKGSARRPRTISSALLVDRGEGVHEIRITGDGFGRYQVRYLVGSSVGVAAGLIREDDFRAGLERGTEFAGLKAPASGLTLWEVHYPLELDPFREDRVHFRGVPGAPPF